jgi:hypothetical protein
LLRGFAGRSRERTRSQGWLLRKIAGIGRRGQRRTGYRRPRGPQRPVSSRHRKHGHQHLHGRDGVPTARAGWISRIQRPRDGLSLHRARAVRKGRHGHPLFGHQRSAGPWRLMSRHFNSGDRSLRGRDGASLARHASSEEGCRHGQKFFGHRWTDGPRRRLSRQVRFGYHMPCGRDG